jgi:hypothetical protein
VTRDSAEEHTLVILFAVAFVFLFVLFLVWLLSKQDIGSCRAIRIGVEALREFILLMFHMVL